MQDVLWPTPSGIDYEQAYNRCSSALVGSSLEAAGCGVTINIDLEGAIQNCVNDIKVCQKCEKPENNTEVHTYISLFYLFFL